MEIIGYGAYNIALQVEVETTATIMKSMKSLKWAKWHPYSSTDGVEHCFIYVLLYIYMETLRYMEQQ